MLTSVNGTTLFSESLGQGRAMMVLHGGLGFDHTYFRPFLDPLADELRLVYLDHPGHGRSGGPPIVPLYFVRFDPQIAADLDRVGSYSGAALHRAFSDLVPSYNVASRLAEIRVPTLILSGRHDWITPPAHGGERLQRGIPGSELVVFERSGHYPFIEEQPAFLSAVRGWVSRLPKAAE